MRAIFAVGVRRALPPIGGVEVVRLPPGKYREAARPRRQGTVVLLGPDAVIRFGIPQLRTFRWSPYTLLYCVDVTAVEREVLRRWECEGVGVLAEDDPLELIVERALRIEPRVRIEPKFWVPDGADKDPFIHEAVQAIPGLWKHDVVDWTAEVDMDRRELCDRCKACMGKPAKRVCWLYVHAYAWFERARGVPWGHITAALNYGNVSSLRAAVGARGWRLGPRGRARLEAWWAERRATPKAPAVPTESPSISTVSPLGIVETP